MDHTEQIVESPQDNATDYNVLNELKASAPQARTEQPAHPPKVLALLQGLREEWEQDPTQKAVVFSQFTGMLDLVQRALEVRLKLSRSAHPLQGRFECLQFS